jgi:sodium-dependent phosphate cotransporter
LKNEFYNASFQVIKEYLNADLPYVPWLTGYVELLVGAAITFLVQSSSVFTSTLTPLVGTGLFTLERAYALTLGINAIV